jgi:hypothetical protein
MYSVLVSYVAYFSLMGRTTCFVTDSCFFLIDFLHGGELCIVRMVVLFLLLVLYGTLYFTNSGYTCVTVN